MIGRDQFREVVSKFASGVTIITTSDERGFHGVTVSSFCSLSLDPPLILLCVDKSIQSHDLITSARTFVVNILSRGQTFPGRAVLRPDATGGSAIQQSAVQIERVGAADNRCVGRFSRM